MTQQTDEHQQKYSRFSSQTFETYGEAKMVATATYQVFTGEEIVPADMTTEKIKVRIKRRVKNGRESFDVIGYKRIGDTRTGEVKVHGPETFAAPAEWDGIPSSGPCVDFTSKKKKA